MHSRRQLIALCGAAAATTLVGTSALAQNFPTKPIRLLVPYPAGGPFDVLAREMAKSLQEAWSQPVVVENKPGANEIVAADVVAKSAPDGYTLLMSSESATVINPLLYRKLPYNAASDLRPVARLASAPFVLVARSSFPASTLPDFIVRAKAEPGKFNFGSGGMGNPSHLALAMMEKRYDIRVAHVPYNGAGPVLQGLLSGSIDISFFPVSIVEPHIRAGTLRGLAISGDARVPSLPSTPTFREAGVADVNASFYFQLVAPAKTPDAVVARVRGQVHKVVADKEFQKKFMDAYGLVPVIETEEEFAQFRTRDQQVQAEKIKASGVVLDL